MEKLYLDVERKICQFIILCFVQTSHQLSMTLIFISSSKFPFQFIPTYTVVSLYACLDLLNRLTRSIFTFIRLGHLPPDCNHPLERTLR